MRSQRPGKSSVLAIAFIVLAGPTWAHHGIGRFDPTRELTVEGTLTGLEFVNPHSYVHFNAVDANGAVVAMQCEMRRPRCCAVRAGRPTCSCRASR